MRSLLKSWLRREPHPARRPTFRPRVEAMEQRDVPTGIFLADGNLLILGGASSDTARVTIDNRGTLLNIHDDRITATLVQQIGQPAALVIDAYRLVPAFPAARWEANVTSLYFGGVGGDDTFVNSVGLPSLAYGGSGNDTFTGGIGIDTFHGEAGADRLSGANGDDVLSGGAGDDMIFGGDHNDRLDGNENTDCLYGERGRDTVDGGGSADLIYGGEGDDQLAGGAGDDQVFGDGGADRLNGNDGNDRLFGDDGADDLDGGADNDWLEAGTAGEVAIGGSGQDFNAHDWTLNGAAYTDINQMGSPTCTFLSTLSSLAWTGDVDLEARIGYRGNYVYWVQIYKQSGQLWLQEVRFDGTFTVNAGPGGNLRAFNGGTTFYDPQPAGDESWVILMQRAYAQQMNEENRVGNDDFARPGVAHKALTGESGTQHDYNPGGVEGAFGELVGAWSSVSFADLTAYVADRDRTLTCGTWNDADDLTDPQLVAQHAYTILGTRTDADGDRFVRLRNPWGKDNTEAGIDAGNVTGFARDGEIEISWEDFNASIETVYVGCRL